MTNINMDKIFFLSFKENTEKSDTFLSHCSTKNFPSYFVRLRYETLSLLTFFEASLRIVLYC